MRQDCLGVQERPTKCLCIQAAYFASGGVGRAKIVLDVVHGYACGNFTPSALPNTKPLAFGATIHFVRSSRNFGPCEGVWVTDFASAMGLAAALRMGLINAAREKVLAANQETMKDHVYRYITGPEFTMQVRAIAEGFIRLGRTKRVRHLL